MEEKKEKRITLRKKLPKVNQELAEHLLRRPDTKKQIRDAVAENDVGAAEDTIDNPLLDDRFHDMFNDPAFEIRKESEDYRRIHPSSVRHVAQKVRNERFDLILDEQLDSDMEEGIYHEGEVSDGEEGSGERKTSMFQLKDGKDVPLSFDDSGDDSGDEKTFTIEERIRQQDEILNSKLKAKQSQPHSELDNPLDKMKSKKKSTKKMNPFRKSKRRSSHH